MISRALTAIRRNVVAWLALFVALGGTSMAASHYIITSTHQIKPSVLKQLHGARGGAGATGAAGTQGKEGPVGKEGKEGLAGKEGSVGKPGVKGEGKEGPAGPTGLKGETGTQGNEGPAGKEGPAGTEGKEGKEGPKGENGTAIAFAHVTASGKVEPAGDSKGFAGATVENPAGKAGEGIYCISGLGTEPHNVTVTPDAKESEEAFFATASLGKSAYVEKAKLCGSGTQITVETWLTAKETKNVSFFIAIN